MIKEIKGDLIRSAKNGEFDLIAHQANCFNTMGSGIAKSIKEEWPEAAAVDSATIKGDRSKLGTISFTTNTNPIIVNLYGQFDYWSPGVLTDYDALEKALLKMKETFPSKKIGMPKIGSLRARGDWNVIFKIIEKVFCDPNDDVTIVEWEKNDYNPKSSGDNNKSVVSPIISSLSIFNNPNTTPMSTQDSDDKTKKNQVAVKKFHGKRKCRICNVYHPIRDLINYVPSVWICKQNCNKEFMDKIINVQKNMSLYI
jgi:O-acetyl-ADP-ribose deacetylase (regulator of RNase III)